LDRKKIERILEETDGFFRARIEKFGITPEGVGWKNAEAQRMRFRTFVDVVLPEHRQTTVSFHDVGCGMGHLKDYLDKSGLPYTYTGSDALPRMLEIAKKRHPATDFIRLNLLSDPPLPGRYDYVVVNGAFHYLAPAVSWEEWRDTVHEMLGKVWQMTGVGMACNFLTDRVDWRDPELFYISPSEIIDFIRGFTRLFVIRHDYYPFEFTIFAYREEGSG